MRITVLCTDLGVRVPGDKGASMHLQSITSAFAANGHQVQLIGVAGHGEPPSELEQVLLLPHPGRAEGLRRERNKLAFVDRTVVEARDAVRSFAPELLYERLSLFGTAGLRLQPSTGGARHVLEVNALVAEEEARWRDLQQRWLAFDTERRVLEAAHHVVAVSDEVAADVRRVAPDAACTVVPNGAEVERFADLPPSAEARCALGLPADVRLACFVGALRPWHGVDVAIRAVARTAGVHLVVVGDGPVRSDLELLAGELRVAERIHFLGQRPHGDVALALAATDVAVAPYPALEGFAFSPLKLYEYLASGKPVVASAIGQIPEALGHGAFGTLIRPGDDADLARALDEVTVEPAAQQRAVAGREHALAHHGWRDRAARIVALAEASHALA